MPSVVVEHEMIGASRDRVWSIARELADYPKFMDQVLQVDPCEVPGAEHATAWTVLFNGNELQWVEVDTYDDAAFRMTFEQVEGDLAEWRGCFVAEQGDGRVLARYEVTFDLGVPALAHMLHPLGERAIRDNCAQMLSELESRSRMAPVDA